MCYPVLSVQTSITGSMVGQLQPLVNEEEEEEEEDEVEVASHSSAKPQGRTGGVLSFFKSLTAGRTITRDALEPALDKMRVHLISECKHH